jgi:hypothetical protein
MRNLGELGLSLYLEVFRLDPKTKKVIERILDGEDPFVVHALDWLYSSFANVNVSTKDTGGTVRSSGSAVYMGYNGFGDLGSTTRGILVGSNSTPVTLDDYQLGTLIAHGSGSGQLFYYAGLTEYVASIANKRIRLYQRPIANKSGANITVYEMGLVLTSNNAWNFLLARNVIGSGLVLVNGGYYLFQYAFEVAP